MIAVALWIIVIIVVIRLAVVFKPVRWIIGALVLLVLIGVGYLLNQDAESQREREAAKHRVTPAQIELEDLRLSGYSGYSNSITGRIRNRATQYTITNVELNVTVRDCTAPNQCDTVGEVTTSPYLDVPPLQVRAFNATVYFSDLPPARGQYEWSYTIASVSAQ